MHVVDACRAVVVGVIRFANFGAAEDGAEVGVHMLQMYVLVEVDAIGVKVLGRGVDAIGEEAEDLNSNSSRPVLVCRGQSTVEVGE